MKKNQGFSLVELIVVIAIMAVLVGVLAPAYLRYVEKSRKSTDVSSISDILAAAEKVAIDPQWDLEAMLTKMADYYDEEVEAATQALMAALEPVIILLMAGICGVIIGAVIAPMGALYSGLDNL